MRKFGIANHRTIYKHLRQTNQPLWKDSRPRDALPPTQAQLTAVAEQLAGGLHGQLEIAQALRLDPSTVRQALKALGVSTAASAVVGTVSRDQLVRAVLRGRSKRGVAAVLGVSPATVDRLLAVHGLKLPPRPSTADLAEAMWLEGTSLTDIARRLGLQRMSVRTGLRRRGHNPPSLRPNPLAGLTPEAVVKLRNDLGSWNRVEQHLGSVDGLRAYRKLHRLDERFGPFVEQRFHTRRPSRWGPGG